MNGHSNAESLAFCVTEIARRWPLIGVADDSAIFVFAAGCGSAERRFARRLTRAMADESAFDPALVAALANQVARTGRMATANGASGEAPAGNEQATRLTQLVHAQATFVRDACRSRATNAPSDSWGMTSTVLSGDLALYFRLLFPLAKFLFVHRNPSEAFAAALSGMEPGAAAERDRSWAESFANEWCRLAASFELWHKDAGGIVVGYEAAMAASATDIEAYLGEKLLPADDSPGPARMPDGAASLRPDELTLLIERTGELAARLGYSLAADAAPGGEAAPEPLAGATAPYMHTESARVSCALLVPTMRYIEPECEEGLLELERRGYAVLRLRGCPSIDQGRNMLATSALEQGFEETLWIDADTIFDPDVVERARSHGLPIVAGICARKRPKGGLAVAPLPGTRELTMGEAGGLVEVLYAGTGFLLVRSEVYSAIQRRFNLPLCGADSPQRAVPFFMPMLEDWGGRLSYLGEDYAFSRRARLCGFKIMADTSIRLWHLGMYRFGYEDAGNEVERLATYHHRFTDQTERTNSRQP